MSKFTKIRKWANEKGYKIEDASISYIPAIRVIVDEENRFKCEERRSTVYMSIRGQKGDAGGLYLTHEYKPKDGRFVRPYGFWKASQKEMIEDIEREIQKQIKC